MGQQQLLLIILVTIIVGIATVVAINTFSAAFQSSNIDAVRQDVLEITVQAQAYFQKPRVLGGGDKSFSNFTFRSIPFNTDSVEFTQALVAINANGKYEITARGTSGFEITAHPSSRISGDVNFSSTATIGDGALVADVSEGGLSWSDPD